MFNSDKVTNKIRVFPQGLALAGDEMTSFILFKDKAGAVSFPVWCPVLPLNILPVDGELELRNPYELSHELLEKLDYKIIECVFDQIDSDEQMATLYLEKRQPEVPEKQKSTDLEPQVQLSFLESSLDPSPEIFPTVKSIHLKAFEALALCSPRTDIIFSATDAFIQKTRDVAVFEKKNPSDLLKKNSFLKSRQKYLM